MTVLTAPERAASKFLASFPLSTGHAVVYARAADIDPAVWEVAFADSHKDFAYYQLLEDTMKEGFDYRYLVLSDALDNTLALQPLILVDQDLTASAKSFFTSAVIFLRKFWPRFFRKKMLMAGCLVGDGRLGVIAPENLQTASALLAEALLVYAQRENVSLLAIKDFPASLRQQLLPLAGAHYTRLPGFPALVLDLNFGSFEEYMQKRLSRATRKGLRRKLRRSQEVSPPITMEVIHDCSTVIDEIYPLYLRVAERSPVQFEIFTREYFLETGKRMPERHRYFIWRQAGKVIAFSFCTIWNDSIYDNDIGLDYDVAHNLSLYYLTFRDLIAWALRQGLRFYHSAPFNYDPKLHLRLKPVDVDVYVRHTSPVVNWILKKVAPRFAPANSDPVLRQYRGEAARSLWKRFLRLFGNPWLQIALNAVIVTASELFLKLGARNTAHLTEGWNWTGISALASVWTWLGIVFVMLSLFSWLYVLRHVPLSIAFPLSNVVHVLVPLSCWVFLGELISTTRWWGIALVLVGLLIVAKPFARIEEKL
jgi:predicted N-acyltransferase/multidrug transporter EmrE-like cation transporter